MGRAKEGIGKDIFRNSLQQLISTIINRAGGLIFTIIIARLLEPELFGVYSLALSLMLITLTFADFGLGQTLIRYVSEAYGKKDKALARSYFKFLFKFKILITFAFSLALFLLSNVIAVTIFKNSGLILPIRASALYLFIVSTLDFITFTFFATKNVKYYTLRETIFQVSRIILVPILIILLAVKFKVVGIFIALSLSAFIALLVSLYYLRKNYGFLLKGKIIKIDKKRLLRFALFLVIGIMPGVFFTYIDSLMLGAMVPIKFVGFYRAAYTIATSFGSLMVFYLVLFPFFTQLKGKQLADTFKKIIYFVSIIAFPLAFGVALLSGPFIKVLFGAEYAPAILPLYILAFIIIDMAIFSYFTVLFQAKEKPEVPTKIVAVAAVLNIVLNLVLIKAFAAIRVELAMVGAALATFISRYFYGVAIWIAAAKQLKIKPEAASIYKPLIASIGMAAFLVILLLSFPRTVVFGVIEIFLAAIVYFTILFMIKGIKKEDILYLKRLILK